jgi:hypothetical protein
MANVERVAREVVEQGIFLKNAIVVEAGFIAKNEVAVIVTNCN